MDIVKLVAEKAGIGEMQAQIAVSVISGVLKDKLPAPLAGQLDSILGASSGNNNADGGLMGQAGNVLGGLKGMFG